MAVYVLLTLQAHKAYTAIIIPIHSKYRLSSAPCTCPYAYAAQLLIQL